jgi:hypothetical protein
MSIIPTPECIRVAQDNLSTRSAGAFLRGLGSARIPRFDRGLVVQNHVQQGIMDLEFSVVFDKTQFAEFVHEKAHA